MNGFNGTLDNALTLNNKQKISTFDSDNDSDSTCHCCAFKYFSGWWFADCFSTPVNGKYYPGGKIAIDKDSENILTFTGIHWQ